MYFLLKTNKTEKTKCLYLNAKMGCPSETQAVGADCDRVFRVRLFMELCGLPICHISVSPVLSHFLRELWPKLKPCWWFFCEVTLCKSVQTYVCRGRKENQSNLVAALFPGINLVASFLFRKTDSVPLYEVFSFQKVLIKMVFIFQMKF